MREILELDNINEIITDLKSNSLQYRHWDKICAIIRRPDLLNNDFSLEDLLNTNIIKFNLQIKDIVAESQIDHKYELILNNIASEWKE